MLHAGLDRKRLDLCLLGDEGEHPPDRLRGNAGDDILDGGASGSLARQPAPGAGQLS